jgi:hypothetical protein
VSSSEPFSLRSRRPFCIHQNFPLQFSIQPYKLILDVICPKYLISLSSSTRYCWIFHGFSIALIELFHRLWQDYRLRDERIHFRGSELVLESMKALWIKIVLTCRPFRRPVCEKVPSLQRKKAGKGSAVSCWTRQRSESSGTDDIRAELVRLNPELNKEQLLSAKLVCLGRHQPIRTLRRLWFRTRNDFGVRPPVKTLGLTQISD